MFRFVIGVAAVVWSVKTSLELDNKYHIKDRICKKFNEIKDEYFSDVDINTSSDGTSKNID